MKKNLYLAGFLALCFILSSVSGKAAGITTDPRDTTVCSGIQTMFTVTDTGALPITFMWQISNDGGATWATLSDTLLYSGSHTDTLLVTADVSISGNLFRAIDSNAFGIDTSTAAILTVLTVPATGVITGATGSCVGATVTLSSSVAGGAWSSSNTAIATIGSDGDVTGVSSGTDTIYYSLTNGCGTGSSMLVFNVDNPASPMAITGPGSTCVGGTIHLANANVAGTWVWSASNSNATVSTTGAVTGVSQGSVIISYTFTNGCNTVVSTRSITIDTLLAPGTISGTTNVCAGSWVSLTASLPGGFWLSSSTPVAVVDASGNVTGVSVGTSVISYYLSNACGASIGTHTVTVDINASSIAGSDSVGIGGTVSLSNLAPGGMWFSSDTVATIDTFTGVATGVTAGTTTISYMVTNSCGTSMATMVLHVGTPFTGGITGPDSVCTGTTITLADTIGGIWTIATGDTIIRATIDSFTGVVHGLVAGFDTVYYTVTDGFGTATISKVIYVNEAPVVTLTGPPLVAKGGEYPVTGHPANGIFGHSNSVMGLFISYTNIGSPTIPATYVTQANYVVLKPGTDIISYTVSNTCGTSTKQFTVTLAGSNQVGEPVNGVSVLNVYPNPTQESFTMKLQTNTTEQATVVITNVAGEKVKEVIVSTNTAVNVKLDQAPGIYFLSATTTEGTYNATITLTR